MHLSMLMAPPSTTRIWWSACVVGDGEAETGPLATSWHANKFLNPVPTARCCRSCTSTVTRSRTHRPRPHSGARARRADARLRIRAAASSTPGTTRRRCTRASRRLLDEALDRIEEIQRARAIDGAIPRPTWPMIVLRSPKGWTGPPSRRREADGRNLALASGADDRCAHEPGSPASARGVAAQLSAEELFDESGRSSPELAAIAPKGERRMSANPHANGGLLLRDLVLPDFRDYAVEVTTPGRVTGIDARARARSCAT